MDLHAVKSEFARRAVAAFASGDQEEAKRLLGLAQDAAKAAIAASVLDEQQRRDCEALLPSTLPDTRADEDAPASYFAPKRNEKYFKDGRPQLVSTRDWHRAATRVLEWVALHHSGGEFFLDQPYIPTYGLVGIAACCRVQRPNASRLRLDHGSQSAHFAQAIGLQSVIATSRPFVPAEAERTVPLGRVLSRAQVTSMALQMSELVVPERDNKYLRDVVNYSLVELLRNVVQHSADPLGGIAAAQMIPAEHGPSGLESIQIAVADMGVGIERTLAPLHSDVEGDARAAINKAMRPRISGTFREGDFGSEENAGLGLFFLTRMTKLLKGRFLLASKGAALSADGLDSEGHLQQRFLGVDFPGTLAVFEIPREFPDQFKTQEGVVEFIREHELPVISAEKSNAVYWIHMYEPHDEVKAHRVVVAVAGTDFGSIRKLVEVSILPAIRSGTPVSMDFVNVGLLTDSMAHELVGLAVREAYMSQVPVYAVNTTPAIARTLVFVQSYLLADLAPKRRRRRT